MRASRRFTRYHVTPNPMMGGGLFSSASGGMMAAGGSLMGHLPYGGALALIAVESKALAARA